MDRGLRQTSQNLRSTSLHQQHISKDTTRQGGRFLIKDTAGKKVSTALKPYQCSLHCFFFKLGLSHKYRSNAECPTCLCREAPQIRTVKGTACASKKNKTFHRKVFPATFHTSRHLFDTCDKNGIKSATLWKTLSFEKKISVILVFSCVLHTGG